MTAELIEPDLTLEFTRDVAVEYAALVEHGLNLSKTKDICHWLLGDDVRKLMTDFSKYAECTVENYADAIKVSHSSAYEYAGMASFYSLAIREELSELDLSYSHYREARKLKTLDKAIEFLKTIALKKWTIQQTRDALKALKRMGHEVDDRYSDAPPPTDLNHQPFDRNPLAVWRGVGILKVDSKGRAQLHIEAPDLEPDKEYIVIIQEVDR